MVNSALIPIVYVNPVTGNDANPGSRSKPYKTITHALQVNKAPTEIKLALGTYNIANGEVFPLAIPVGIVVVGNEATKGRGVLISGSGKYQTQSFGLQNITLLVSDACVKGVTVNTALVKGTGVWIESTTAILANNTFSECGREGVFVSADAKPIITDNIFVKNVASGLVMARKSQGEVQRNIWEKNALGIAISDYAAPLITDNKLLENHTAIALSRNAQPILRSNLFQKNQGGLFVNGNAIPDLGNMQESGDNIFLENKIFDLQNATPQELISSGNRLNSDQTKGEVKFIEPIKNQINFSDISQHWAGAFLEALANKGLLKESSHGTYQPDAPMTRAEYADLVVKAFNPTPKQTEVNFADVNKDFWAYGAIEQAALSGFVGLGRDLRFRPEQNVLRIQVIVSLVNGLGLPLGSRDALLIYNDRDSIHENARTAVASATTQRIVVNYPDPKQIQPNQSATRAQVAVMVYQALVAIGKMPNINLPYIVSYTDTSK